MVELGEGRECGLVVGLDAGVAFQFLLGLGEGASEADSVVVPASDVGVDAVVSDVLADVVEAFLGAEVQLFSEVTKCVHGGGEDVSGGGDGGEDGSDRGGSGVRDAVGHGRFLARERRVPTGVQWWAHWGWHPVGGRLSSDAELWVLGQDTWPVRWREDAMTGGARDVG